jgi:Major capsid protein Gp23
MQITTTLHTKWAKFVTWIYEKLDNRLWKERMEKAMRDVPTEHQPLFSAVLTNQMNHQRQDARVGARTNSRQRAAQVLYDNTLFEIVKQALIHLQELRAVVGIQPMRGPVDTVFHMRYKTQNDQQQPESGGRVIRLEVVRGVVEACSRKMQSRWTMEMAQDMQTMHGVDIADELVKVLAHSIAYEIASEVFSDLRALAEQSSKVDNQAGSFIDDKSPEDTFVRNATLAIKVDTLANQVGMESRRGPANFIIGNAVSTSLLQTLGSAFVPVPEGTKRGMLLSQLGTLNGSIKVYYSLAIPDDVLIIGYKGGSGDTDAGYIYAPYVPLMVTNPMIDPATFQPVMQTMTRYGKYVGKKGEHDLNGGEAYYAVLTLGSKPLATTVDQPETVK